MIALLIVILLSCIGSWYIALKTTDEVQGIAIIFTVVYGVIFLVLGAILTIPHTPEAMNSAIEECVKYFDSTKELCELYIRRNQ